MAIDGNLEAGQMIIKALPKILVGGVELAGGVQKQDERLSYYRNTKNVVGDAVLTITTTDHAVQIHYTLNGRTPTSKSPKYTGPITLRQNSTGDNTVIKARVFKQGNTNIVSKIIKATLNVVGGNTIVTPSN